MSTKNIHIEGLRGIAILFVVTYHFFYRYQQLYLENYNGSIIVSTFGMFGLALFLCITGYFINSPTEKFGGVPVNHKKIGANMAILFCCNNIVFYP